MVGFKLGMDICMYVPSKSIIGLESCWKKLEVSLAISTVTPPRGGKGDRVAVVVRRRRLPTCAGGDALTPAQPTGTMTAIEFCF